MQQANLLDKKGESGTVFFRDDTLYFRAIQQGLKCQHKCQERMFFLHFIKSGLLRACYSGSGLARWDVWVIL